MNKKIEIFAIYYLKLIKFFFHSDSSIHNLTPSHVICVLFFIITDSFISISMILVIDNVIILEVV